MSKANKSPGTGEGTEAFVESQHLDNTENTRTRQQEWRRQNPIKYLAHLYLNNALKLGVIQRQPCQVCADPKSEGHHPNYREPARVVWLCRRHHSQLHARERGQAL